ncbi:PH domain-containing protein [Sedimentisphaera salicampi]|uniref:PH domain-containing protein n=1 Tax=Sedimentisphaera salicampi TaxID=1941349 RepID=UPI000B9BF13F|nr:PH domain-containing protein [Sedimentisphaera salicampi]OXU14539.1 putative membrane protein [Sedimentisphaera salicampi]
MYCSKCGRQISEDARFCEGCGAPTAEYNSAGSSQNDHTQHDAGSPSIKVSPTFNPLLSVASFIPVQLFLTAWGAGFLGGMSLGAVKAWKLGIPEWAPFVFFGALFFFAVPALVYFFKKKTYEKTEYRFFKDRLEYSEGFLTAQDKTIKYDKITETSMRRGVVQKRFGLGTIFLATPASGYQQNRASSGIRIKDVEQPEKLYAQIESLIGK